MTQKSINSNINYQFNHNNYSRYDLPEKYLHECVKKFLYNSNIENFSREICCVCGEIKIAPRDKITKKQINFLLKYKNILHFTNLAYEFDHANFYYGKEFLELNGFVLEKNGLNYNDLTINLCGNCEAYLIKYETPKYGLINELYIGSIPQQLTDLSFSEEILISKNRLVCSIFKLKKSNDQSSGQNKIIGNVVTFNQDVEGVSNLLPNLTHLDNLKIILIGSNIENTIDFKKIFSVRLYKVISALKWLKKHNKEYNDVSIDENIKIDIDIDLIPKILRDKIIYMDENDPKKNNYEESKDTNDLNNDILLNSFGLINNHNRLLINDNEKLQKLHDILYIKSLEPALLVPRSKFPENEYNNKKLLLHLYPTLFPYGYGGFNDDLRKQPLSEREHTKHYLKTHCGRFVKNRTFIFVAFNMIQRHEFSLNLSIMTKKKYFENVSYFLSQITKEDIQNEIEKVLSTGEIQNQNIKELFHQSVIMSKNTQGSRFNLKHRRNDIRSYIIQKGLPSFYITLNPNDLNSPLILFLSGKEINENLILRSIDIANDPVSQSLNFDILIENFINFILGEKNCNNLGIFGKINGYYGMVEAQARGSLHIHFLIWIEDSLNPDEYEKFIDNPANKLKLLNYINRHVKCNLSDFRSDWKEKSTHEKCHKTVTTHLKSSEIFDEINFNKEIFKLANETNIHNCTSACYKNKKKTCRYGFGKDGKELIQETNFDSNNTLFLKRDHCFLNNFNPYILYSFRCNHDIKWIEKSKKESLASLYYITNYVTKHGVSIHNFLSFVSVYFEKYHGKNLYDENILKAKKMLQNIFTICTSQTEYSSAQIAHMIFSYDNDGTYYSSDQKVLLYYPKYLSYINNEQQISDDSNLINLDNSSNKYDDRLDYVYRPKELEHVSLFEFYSYYKKVFTSQINNGHKPLKFLDKHPQKTSVIIENEKTHVPIILGKQITDHDNENYSKIILLLFKPWRDNLDLKKEMQTFSDSLSNFLNNNNSTNIERIKKYIYNIQLLKRSKEDGANQYHAYINGSSNKTEDEIFEPLLDVIPEDDFDISHYYNSDEQDQFVINLSVDKNYKIENSIVEYIDPKHSEPESILKNEKILSVHNDISKEIIEHATLLSIKSNILNVNDIIQIFNLNYKQALSCKIFLNENQDQKIMYIGGDGGVGKSRVISAIEFFFSFNNRHDEIKICAYTGTASNLINGNTIHSTFKFSYKAKDNDNRIYFNFDEKKNWNKIAYLIIDEISMVSLNLLADIDISLREIKDKNHIFGNINILFVGDFFQFPPVAAFPLYKNIKFDNEMLTTDNFSEYLKKAYNGKILWKNLKEVIFLDEPMRQINDIAYANFLKRVKNGKTTEEDITNLKKKIISEPIKNPFEKNIIVSNNSLKMQLIISIVKHIEIYNNKLIVKTKAIDFILHESQKDKTYTLTNATIDFFLKNIEESKTEYLSYSIPLSTSIKYYLTHTVNSKIGLTNGTIISLKKIFIKNNGEIAHLLCEVTDYRKPFQLENLEKNHFILERLQRYFYIQISREKYSIKRQQFPITPKFVSTCHKVQGKTLENMIVDLNIFNNKFNACCYLYVALSRLKTWDNLLVLRDFEPSIFNFKQDPDLLTEIERLKIIEEITLAKYS
ncbi:unnamed protein product [Brachionus calyciflorus]|uniref:ATP-dependent DNA helicase n=1 Tax=Brachionus calyciflorus TaxID=104777 RepID=A0A814FAA2_9BILA|nr:unnamed protein product [Brachionus calyciflorus]